MDLKAIKRLQQSFTLTIPQHVLLDVARCFRTYTEKIGAQEEALYSDGRTEQYVALFVPLITRFVEQCTKLSLETDDLAEWLITRAQRFMRGTSVANKSSSGWTTLEITL
jgi:hypothetical protein